MPRQKSEGEERRQVTEEPGIWVGHHTRFHMPLNHIVINAHVDHISCHDRRAKVKSEGGEQRLH